jgi:hypothetical protein
MDKITMEVELDEGVLCDDEASASELVELPITELEEVAGGQSSAAILD